MFKGNRSYVCFYRIYVTIFWLFVDYRGIDPADCPELVLLNALLWSTAAILSWNLTQAQSNRNQDFLVPVLDSSRASVAPLRWIRVTQALGTRLVTVGNHFCFKLLSLRRRAGSPWFTDFLVWNQPELSILAAGQKDRGLWGREFLLWW